MKTKTTGSSSGFSGSGVTSVDCSSAVEERSFLPRRFAQKRFLGCSRSAILQRSAPLPGDEAPAVGGVRGRLSRRQAGAAETLDVSERHVLRVVLRREDRPDGAVAARHQLVAPAAAERRGGSCRAAAHREEERRGSRAEEERAGSAGPEEERGGERRREQGAPDQRRREEGALDQRRREEERGGESRERRTRGGESRERWTRGGERRRE
ncbi:hypothetical protein EYF80_062432 [Liparis tanakae]|uniref:Uncharacterized protein n=1 Tax=Liparis tanakae TaxID=230148 RepID=A0A4Z2EFE4_9TELE|nr:hypothetical protein EYF80_062432 [Liparis tanakae]